MPRSFISGEICLRQVKPSSDPSTAIQTSIADAMRVVRMISIKNADPSIFLLWTKNVFSYIHGLSGDNLHLVLIIIAFRIDNYSLLIITAFLRIQ